MPTQFTVVYTYIGVGLRVVTWCYQRYFTGWLLDNDVIMMQLCISRMSVMWRLAMKVTLIWRVPRATPSSILNNSSILIGWRLANSYRLSYKRHCRLWSGIYLMSATNFGSLNIKMIACVVCYSIRWRILTNQQNCWIASTFKIFV